MEKVVVLMSTYNGEKYLRTQIDSLLKQEGVQAEILVRDDGSSDSTLEILESYVNSGDGTIRDRDANKNVFVSSSEEGSEENSNQSPDSGLERNPDRRGCRISYYRGANVGPAKSFLDLMKHAPEADFYALCDQDDTWLPDKLKIAVEAVGKGGNEIPVLYYGMPRFADNDGNLLKGPKGIYESALDFPSCLIKSNSTGCTMVFNRRLLDIINEKTPGDITMHDEWLHKVCLGLGGKLIYDEDVHILYRQHGGNTIGGQLSGKKVLKRYINTFMEADCIRSRCIKTLIECYGDRMPERNLELAMEVSEYKKSLSARLRLIFDNRVRTAYMKRNLMFKLSVLMGAF